MSKRYERNYNSIHGVAVGSTSLSATLAGVSLGVMANPVTQIPAVSVSIGLADIGPLTAFCSKLEIKRIKKHDQLE